MPTTVEIAKFLCARHENIMEGLKDTLPGFLSVDEVDETQEDSEGEITDVLIDFVYDGTEYRLRMGMRPRLRLSLVKFHPSTEEDELPTPEQMLLVELEGDEEETWRGWERHVIKCIGDALQ